VSSSIGLRPRRSLVAPLVVTVIVVVAAIALRAPLWAWFTGKPLGGSEGAPVTAQAGPFTLEARLAPDPPREKDQELVLAIRDAAGKPVDHAAVDVAYDMPAMGSMAAMKGGATVKATGDGVYRARFDLPMSGSWTLRASVHDASGSGSQSFQMTVGTAGLTLRAGSPAAPGEIDHYTCSMHPSVKQAGPGVCPICGMNLVPVTKEQQQEGVVMIDEARRQLIGVRTEPVVEAPMRNSFRAVGRVTYDESSLADVNLKVRGWITKLYVNQTGQRVARGQTLFTMYSPELYNAEQDFLLGTKRTGVGPPSGDGGSRLDLFAGASRQRLHLLGLDDAQIEAIAQSGKPSEDLAIPSPANGFVIEKNVVEGAAVDAGMKLYRIAALSKVWVEADVFESDLAHVRAGQHARVTLDYLPGRSYDAKVAYVYPYLDPATRTGRVRLELANKELDLRPGMYASVELSSDLGPRLQVPTAAVVYTGPRRLVFVDLGNGRFRPGEVVVGTESNGMYEVLSGLKAGDSVATSGVFLIAAEARITTAANYWDSTSEATDMERPAETSPAPSPPATSPPMPMPRQALPSPRPASTPSAAASTPAPTDYTCPMHPDVHSAGPGKCPKCGMDLEPRRSTP
jgi:multidrug efflux pump subunit AcrA (membrane-fusion protein)